MSQSNEVEIVMAAPALNFQEYVSGVYRIDSEVAVRLGENSIFDERPKLRQDEAWRQAIGYGTIRFNADSDEPGYLVYQRSKTNGEETMIGDLSIGLGGHVNEPDAGVMVPLPTPFLAKDTPVPYIDILINSSIRELEEEIGISPHPADIDFDHLIIDNESPVGRVHYGLHFFYDAAVGVEELVPASQVIVKGVFSASELRSGVLQRLFKAKFEPWSQYLIDHILR